MTVMDKLRTDYLTARKAHNTLAINLLSTLVGEATAIGKDKAQRETTDDEALALIKRYVDRTKETHALVAAQDNVAACEKARVLLAEITILEAYLPTMLTGDELAAAIKSIIAETPGANMGSVMTALKAQYTGKYDGKDASILVKQALAAK